MRSRSALDLFLARAAARPDAPAILEHGRVAETYGSLARAALSIGAALRARGAGPEHLVGIAARKSAAMVAGMLGAWAAGAAWTVLDPALPGPRRALQLDEGRVRWILAAEDQADTIAADTAAPGHDAPRVLPIARARRTEPLARPARIQPGDLAYAFWTSGSTGRPKGVAVEHRGLPGMLAQQIAAFGLGPGQRSLFVLRASFDAAVSDIGTALLAGACLCIEPALDQGPLAPDALLALMRARGITYADLPPSLLAVLPPDQAPPGLATVVIGGEPCPVDTVRAWAGRVRLVNVYGPTEATVCTSLCVCTGAWDRPLLGAPLRGVVYRVVDGDLREVPAGQPGQLAIGGAQLARGYIARPALEAARFVHLDGDRFFLTGDRVVRAPGGAYHFLGRVDRQVKVRGQLVAPEELEAVLAAHPDVARAHALARDRAGRTTLIALVVPRAGAGPELDARLMAHVTAHLPAWMRPQRIEVVGALPETATGKIDAAALAADLEARADGRPVPAPGRASDHTEGVIARAAARALGTSHVDLRRGLISLGGDSLSVIAMTAACARAGLAVSAGELAADLPLRALARSAGAGAGMSAAVLDRAAALPADIAARLRDLSRPVQGPPRAILITGATGFLGARLLLALGQRSDADLVCLVRANGQEHAWARLRAACDAHAPGALDALAGRARPRVRAVCGDLAAPGLGLAPGAHAALAREVGAVFHCAARVNLVEPLAALAPHNLGGTAEILRFCVEGAVKPLHHASTLSVFVATDRAPGQVSEDDPLDHDARAGAAVFGGYAQSKWAAERLVRRAAPALPVAVYRLGLVTGDPDRGALPGHDFLALLTRGLAALGAVPAAWLDALAVDITPVGFAAPAMAAIALAAHPAMTAAPAPGRTFHIAAQEPVPLRAWIDAMRACGVDIVAVSEDAWRARARRHGPGQGDVAHAAALLGLCRGQGGAAFRANRALDVFQATGTRFDSRRADAALAGAGVDRPAITPALLARYVRRILERA